MHNRHGSEGGKPRMRLVDSTDVGIEPVSILFGDEYGGAAGGIPLFPALRVVRDIPPEWADCTALGPEHEVSAEVERACGACMMGIVCPDRIFDDPRFGIDGPTN